jgi:phosphohistidine phosphatase
MQLLLIRHGIAEDAVRFAFTGGTDAQRPLTASGHKKMRKAASGLRSQVARIDLLACSTLLRARQTAEIIAGAFADLPVLERDDLAPDSELDSLLAWLEGLSSTATVALVGHEPHLNLLAGMLLVGIPRPLFNLKKGAAVLIGFEGKLTAGSGLVHWALIPAQLRGLREQQA